MSITSVTTMMLLINIVLTIISKVAAKTVVHCRQQYKGELKAFLLSILL